MNTYTIIKTTMRGEDCIYTTYGIASMDLKCIKILVSDISPDKKFVEKIVNQCNIYQISTEHIEDFLYDCLVDIH